MKAVLTLFGTRPEIIKLAPVMRALERRSAHIRTINVSSSQHTDLLHPFLRFFAIRVHEDLKVTDPKQTPTLVCARVLSALEPILAHHRPDLMIVQGDTTTALSGALAAFHHGIPVGHVEAGLRSGARRSPFPEEINRRLITGLSDLHFAPTSHSVANLRAEGVPEHAIALTGNPVVDSLHEVLTHTTPSPDVEALLDHLSHLKIVVVTTHRRESFGSIITKNLEILRQFADRHPDVAIVFPVHPNPMVRRVANAALRDHPRIHLTDPLGYFDFVTLLSRAWLIVSDSGGVQEEAPTLGKPVLVLRENTERPEAIDAGVARLVGGDPLRLRLLLEESHADASWIQAVRKTPNPFGAGDSGVRIADAIESFLASHSIS